MREGSLTKIAQNNNVLMYFIQFKIILRKPPTRITFTRLTRSIKIKKYLFERIQIAQDLNIILASVLLNGAQVISPPSNYHDRNIKVQNKQHNVS